MGRDSFQLGSARHLSKNVRPSHGGTVRREYGVALPSAESDAQDERNSDLDDHYASTSIVQESE